MGYYSLGGETGAFDDHLVLNIHASHLQVLTLHLPTFHKASLFTLRKSLLILRELLPPWVSCRLDP